jgi:hypothetical protein
LLKGQLGRKENYGLRSRNHQMQASLACHLMCLLSQGHIRNKQDHGLRRTFPSRHQQVCRLKELSVNLQTD